MYHVNIFFLSCTYISRTKCTYMCQTNFIFNGTKLDIRGTYKYQLTQPYLLTSRNLNVQLTQILFREMNVRNFSNFFIAKEWNVFDDNKNGYEERKIVNSILNYRPYGTQKQRLGQVKYIETVIMIFVYSRVIFAYLEIYWG